MKKATVWICAAAFLVPIGLMADGHEEEPSLTDVWLVVPKQGMEGEFEEAVKAHLAFRADAEESRDWQAYTQVVGHSINVYQYRACCFDWADQDAYVAENTDKGLDAKWDEDVDPYVDHYHHYLENIDRENSHWPDEGTDGPYYGVTTWHWKQGVGPGPDEMRKKLSQIALNDGWAESGRNWLWLQRIGGKPTLMIVAPYASFAEMEPPEKDFFEFVAESAGSPEAAGEMFMAFGAGFSDSDYTIWVHRPDLSSPSDDE